MIMVSLLVLLTVCNPQGEDLIREFVRKDISNERRDAIVEQLKQSDASIVAPKILGIIRNSASPIEPGVGSKPWMSDMHSHTAKVWYASSAIWAELFNGRDDPNKAAILLKLLANNRNDEYSTSKVLRMMQFHRTPETEQQVFNLLHNSETSSSNKRQALEMLIERCGEQYVISAMEFIVASPGWDQCARFTSIFGRATRFASYSEDNQKNIIDLGFSILEFNENQYGYGLARQLGSFLKIPGEFAPDQNAAKYKTERGLNDQFFLDTVRNALEWRKRKAEPQK